jgi:thiol-disulfide isomerase/thioredoxin
VRRPSFWERFKPRRGPRDSIRKALLRGASWSGKEANHFFLNLAGQQFKDISAVAGLDDIADGRSFGIFDYDRDGWLDFAVTNKNEPRIELFRNGIGRLSDQGFVALRFVGGNTSAQPSEWSNRGGYGARVTLQVGDRALLREHRCGEGFAAQNSATLHVGIGQSPSAERLSVTWPSGQLQELADVPSGSLVTVYENPTQSPTGEAFVVSPYLPEGPATLPGPSLQAEAAPSLHLGALQTLAELPAAPRLRLVTTLATWCLPCRREVPVLTALRDRFDATELGLYGVAIDPEDGPEKLAQWNDELDPPYAMLPVSAEERTGVQRMVAEQLGSEGVPATLVLDADGRILHAQWGPPTVSTLRRLLEAS